MRRLAIAAMLLASVFSSRAAPALFGAAGERPSLGGDAPRFSAQLLDGGEFDLGPLLGQKAIVLDFWSIYCVSCVQQIPKLIDLSTRYPDQVTVIGVNLDSFGTKRVAQFVRGLDFRIPYPVVIDKNRLAAAKYSVTELPTTVLIDKRGTIFYYHVGYVPGDESAIDEHVKRAIATP